MTENPFVPALMATVALLVLVLLPASAQDKPPDETGVKTAPTAYKTDPGPHEVGTVEELILRDDKYDKNLSIAVWYPRAEKEFPVIIFSHGAGGSKNTYARLAKFWASHGYVCIFPTHKDSIGASGKDALRGLRDAIGSALGEPKDWAERAHDISFVIDSLGTVAEKAPDLKGKMDAKGIGVGGHSYGAFTSMLIAGAKCELPETELKLTCADSRALAVLNLSGQGTGQMGFTEKSWEKCALPIMMVTGSKDTGVQGQTTEWRKEPFKYCPPGDKYFVFIEDASHFSVAGLPGLAAGLGDRGERGGLRKPPRGEKGKANDEAIFTFVESATVAFWDAYLKYDLKAKKYLESDELRAFSKELVKVERK